MTTDSHCRGSEKNHSEKREGSKANEIWKQMSDEEYNKDKATIRIHQDLLMELLHKSTEDKRYGYVMRKKMKWHGLQEKRDNRMNVQLLEELGNLEQRMDAQWKLENLKGV